jgi:hypothetical protein
MYKHVPPKRCYLPTYQNTRYLNPKFKYLNNYICNDIHSQKKSLTDPLTPTYRHIPHNIWNIRLHVYTTHQSPSIITVALLRLLLKVIYKFKIFPLPLTLTSHLTQINKQESCSALYACASVRCVYTYIHTCMHKCTHRPTNVTVTACNSGFSRKIWALQTAAEPLITTVNETTINALLLILRIPRTSKFFTGKYHNRYCWLVRRTHVEK